MSETASSKRPENAPLWKWSYLACLGGQITLVGLVYHSLAQSDFFVPEIFYWLVAILGMLTIVLMIVGMVKRNISYVWWEVLLLVFAFCGIWILCLAVLPFWLAVLIAGSITLLPYLWPLTLWHDLAFLSGTVGIGLFAAIRFPSNVLLICALGVVLYEFMRAKQAHMATLFSEAYAVGLPPGILLPAEWNGWIKPIGTTWQAGKGMVVGLLPFIIISALALRLARLGWPWFILMVLSMGAAAAFLGQDRHYRLRSWIFPAIAVVFYALAGILQL